jgi:hypothetical protein
MYTWNSKHMLHRVSQQHGASSGCGRRRRPPDMMGSCEHIEQAVADSRQEVVHQFRGWVRNQQLLDALKKSLLLNAVQDIIMETGWEVVDWMHLVQDRDQLRVLLNMVRTFGFHKRWGISWLVKWLTFSRRTLPHVVSWMVMWEGGRNRRWSLVHFNQHIFVTD